MSSDSALSFSALFLSYLLKSAVAYLCLWLLSRCIRNSQVRFLLYALFLGGLVASWVWVFWVFVSPYLPPLRATEVSIAHIALARRFSWPLSSAAVAAVTRGVSGALSAYVMVLGLLLLRFSAHFRRVKSLLRASQKSPAGLSELFESVYSASGAPRCELRLVNDLRSPATTGWWHPKVLLPCELVPRLGTQQLMHILKHELMHVRRRDYLWDRLSTMGCYLTFFHPLVWLARRHLRWERELVCDESVAQRSRESRLEYASCLTTLASWWFLQEEATGQVDFFSSPPSLLAARVRALLVQPPAYSSCKKTALILMATGGLSLPMLLVPEIAISLRFAPVDVVSNKGPSERTAATRIAQGHVSKRRKHVALSTLTATNVTLRSTPPSLNFPVNLPVLSSPATDQGHLYEPDAFESSALAAESAESGEHSQPASTVWDESLPRSPRSRVSKIGTVALRAIRLGIGLAATQIGGHEHEKEP
jgi:beta-lactamase regulating signal transducer with metallopeptidase domain